MCYHYYLILIGLVMKDAMVFATCTSLEEKRGGKTELCLADKDSLDFSQVENKGASQ